jgi:glycosyltransferase involved in cell wall biosynthesis
MRVAIVHYWIVRMRGGEEVLKALLALYPRADVYTNVYNKRLSDNLVLSERNVYTTWINNLPFSTRLYPLYMPLMPGALELLDLSEYDLIISSESGPAKWVIPGPKARHICYIHSPLRYLWDQRHLYRKKVPAPFRPFFDFVTRRLRAEDVLSASRVDLFVANSSFVASRVARYLRRDAVVLHPPVLLSRVPPAGSCDDFYLFVGQLVSYKRVEHAVDACVKLGRRLIVVGDGPGRRYAQRFSSQGVECLGRIERTEMLDLMRRCRALLFPGVEDFGIVPVEVLSAGRPIVAYADGGVLDTVEHRVTGITYDDQSSEGLVRAIVEFEEWMPAFDSSVAQTRAQEFEAGKFSSGWTAIVDGLLGPILK